MRRYLSILVGLVLIAGLATAGSKDTFYGALMGAAVGAAVGHHSGDISTEVAIPAFAAVGALIGYGSDRGWYDDDGYWGYDPWNYGWHDDHFDRYYRYRPQRRVRAVRHSPPVVAPRRPDRRQPDAAPTNLHPGVQLFIVPMTLSNGVAMDLRILKVNDRFIGPRGEEYESMPTADILAQRYRP